MDPFGKRRLPSGNYFVKFFFSTNNEFSFRRKINLFNFVFLHEFSYNMVYTAT